ncbi:MAG: NAD(P)H-hydrate dehydratase [Euryarchaeota archaeon]|nr:NAD(P)H-hydrate dehydratase [Euryarchaeota archaeon]
MTPKDMMVIDSNAENMGISKLTLMENAGRCVANNIFELSKPCKVAIFAGTGGNGGDGFVAARHLLNSGFEVEIFFLSHPSRIRSLEAKANLKVLEKIQYGLSPVKIHALEDSSYLEKTDAEIVLDAILGTGIKGKLKEPVSTAIDVINQSKGTKISVDVPSGVDPLTGEVHDKAVKPDMTVTFHRAKTGLTRADPKYLGKLVVCDIGIPKEVELFVGVGDLLRLKERDPKSHKGHNGKILVVGGGVDYSGAPALAALSSFKSGVDLVYVMSPESVSHTIRSYSPDLIVKSLPGEIISKKHVDEILKFSKKVDSIVIGCGIGRDDDTGDALNDLVCKIKKPMVIDAEALKLLNENTIKNINKINKNDVEVILTPHSAEFKSIFDLNIPQKLEDKIKMVSNASKTSGCVILLKGVIDIISNGDKTRLNKTGNPGMTVGGTGDCLAGIAVGLMAQGHDAFESACLGAFINGRAGDLTSEEYGYNFTATDLLRYIPNAFKY